MNFFSINFGTVLVRFYLMMAVILIGGFSGQLWLAFLGLPIFLSIILGLGIAPKNTAKIVQAHKRTHTAATNHAA